MEFMKWVIRNCLLNEVNCSNYVSIYMSQKRGNVSFFSHAVKYYSCASAIRICKGFFFADWRDKRKAGLQCLERMTIKNTSWCHKLIKRCLPNTNGDPLHFVELGLSNNRSTRSTNSMSTIFLMQNFW